METRPSNGKGIRNLLQEFCEEQDIGHTIVGDPGKTLVDSAQPFTDLLILSLAGVIGNGKEKGFLELRTLDGELLDYFLPRPDDQARARFSIQDRTLYLATRNMRSPFLAAYEIGRDDNHSLTLEEKWCDRNPRYGPQQFQSIAVSETDLHTYEEDGSLTFRDRLTGERIDKIQILEKGQAITNANFSAFADGTSVVCLQGQNKANLYSRDGRSLYSIAIPSSDPFSVQAIAAGDSEGKTLFLSNNEQLYIYQEDVLKGKIIIPLPDDQKITYLHYEPRMGCLTIGTGTFFSNSSTVVLSLNDRTIENLLTR